MTVALTDELWENLSRMVADQTGLYFTKDRWPDLKRGIELAGRELGFQDTRETIQYLLSLPVKPATIELLARHLTIGETYFFRDPQMLEAFQTRILPPLIDARRKARQHYLRIWSAACCTGEEPYSIAILLARLLPDLAEWQIQLIATDLNPQFLKKAEAGVFSQWSFRGLSENWKDTYFTPTSNKRFAILPKYREMVHFSFLNLIEDTHSHAETDMADMDVIFCRNVLMYFSAEQCGKTIEKLKKALAEGGWLISSAAEAGPAFAPLEPVSFPGAMAYRKVTRLPAPPMSAAGTELVEVREASPLGPQATPEVKQAELVELKKVDVEALQKEAQAKADQGQLEEALELCDQALALDKMKGSLHYLKGTILQEQSHLEEAVSSLRRTLYLDREFVLAYFALGTMMRQLGHVREQAKYFETAWHLLQKMPAGEVLAESSGMTAGRLAEMIASINDFRK